MPHQNITLNDLSTIAAINFATGMWQPMILLGAPGLGKTQWILETLRRLYAEHLHVPIDEVGIQIEKPARRDAAEIAGVALPHKTDGGKFETQFSRSPTISRILADGHAFGIMLWDELAAARNPEQKVATDSFDMLERSIGADKIPAGWIVVATGNRAHDRADSQRLLAHLANRALVFNIEFDIRGWAKWAREHNVNPVVIECAEAYADQHFFADAVPVEDGAYCTPRSLCAAARHLDAFMATPDFAGVIPPVVERMLAANIGAAAANTLCQWIAQRDHVPTAAEILRNPETARVPDQTGFQMIAANVAMGAVKDALTAEAVLHYIVRLRTDLQVSLGTKLMRMTTKAGWMMTDPLASAFIARFHQLLPLAVE